MRWLDKLIRRRPTGSLGRRGERAVERFVRRRGYHVIGRGHRYRLGELDLIAVDHRTVVFIEVKTRRRTDGESPAAAVDALKRQRLTRAAFLFLKAHGLLEQAARFDVAAVTWPDTARVPAIEYFENAFEPTGLWQMFS